MNHCPLVFISVCVHPRLDVPVKRVCFFSSSPSWVSDDVMKGFVVNPAVNLPPSSLVSLHARRGVEKNPVRARTPTPKEEERGLPGTRLSDVTFRELGPSSSSSSLHLAPYLLLPASCSLPLAPSPVSYSLSLTLRLLFPPPCLLPPVFYPLPSVSSSLPLPSTPCLLLPDSYILPPAPLTSPCKYFSPFSVLPPLFLSPPSLGHLLALPHVSPLLLLSS